MRWSRLPKIRLGLATRTRFHTWWNSRLLHRSLSYHIQWLGTKFAEFFNNAYVHNVFVKDALTRYLWSFSRYKMDKETFFLCWVPDFLCQPITGSKISCQQNLCLAILLNLLQNAKDLKLPNSNNELHSVEMAQIFIHGSAIKKDFNW